MNDARVFLQHMVQATERILAYTSDITREEFDVSPLVQDGVIRQIQVLGEAAKKVPEEVQEAQDHVPWSDIARMRDRLVHGYFSIDIPTLWSTVEQDIPTLHEDLQRILERVP